ncbi:nestin-like [Solea senegalensis]|uniref:Nestin-like n=1 Tax=Solea senegalensis TaxID=28829 RepID=A0AAV6PT23_SOLSE|nr:nestin [Solea senegalensis]KAG7474365.1 nestin-like [Solea senegalensis]
MELHRVHKTFHHSHLGEEKQQMLDLNRRLETYLNRVKLLEDENGLLAEEIGALRRSSHGTSTRKKGMEEELRQTRLELEAAWRDKLYTEIEIGKLAEEFQALDQQRQVEAQAHVKAKKMVEQSKKELEEEQRAQMWLREKVSQLEHEMRLLIQNHQEDVNHLEATLTHSRATVPPMMAQRGKDQTLTLQQLGQEYSQRATRAWQEAAEAYECQLAQLEESLDQARSRLTQVNQEKSENQLKLRALEKEITSAQDVRVHLEKSATQQWNKHSQEIQRLQTHLEGLESEREELGEQIEHLIQENRGLLQMKMSLGLEVATYRALLDSESLGGNISLSNPSRRISNTDAVFSPQGIKTSYRTQLSASHRTTSVSPRTAQTRATPRATKTMTPLCSRNPTTFNETPNISREPPDAAKSAKLESPYPKILQDGAVESFRPQEVHEKVTYAEPLSPPNEQEAEITLQDKKAQEDRKGVADESPEETPIMECAVSQHVESTLSSEPLLINDEVSLHQFAEPNLALHHVGMTENLHVFSDEFNQEAIAEGPAEKEATQQLHSPVEVLEQKECPEKEIQYEERESSDSETEAVLEPTFESRTSSPVSECEPGESEFNQLTDLSRDENSFDDHAVEIKQENISPVGTDEAEVEDKLYPDGEEMDTWDSVIERKVDPNTDDAIKRDEAKTQHAEPEEDISAREQKQEKKETCPDLGLALGDTAASVTEEQADGDGQGVLLHQENGPPPDEKEDNEEEDSQNISVSWRTEIESDSYAQDNTLADTRPLIRYKSDETDANTQVSHVDESESSEGELEKRMIGEMESGMWTEGKTKKFGTMEDLCEEGEILDEEYDLGYTHIEDRDVSHSMAVSEHDMNDTESAGEVIEEVREEYVDEDTEECTQPKATTKEYYDEEIETDKLVEQELEDLSTDSFSTHFAQQQISESEDMLHLQDKPVQIMANEQEDDPAGTVISQLTSATTIIDQYYENPNVKDLKPLADAVVENIDPADMCAPETREEDDEQYVSMVKHVTEELLGHSDCEPDLDEVEDLDSVPQEEHLQDVAAPTDVKEVTSTEAPESQRHPEKAEWEVLKTPREEHDQRFNKVPDSSESHVFSDRGSDEGVMVHEEEPIESSPDSIPGESDIFVMKDSTQLLSTHGNDNSLPGDFTSDMKNEFWASSLETGATYQPDDAFNQQANQNLLFSDNLVWGNADDPNLVNGNRLVAKKEQEVTHSEVKQVLSRIVVDHSEESEVEAESWSSGEEPV